MDSHTTQSDVSSATNIVSEFFAKNLKPKELASVHLHLGKVYVEASNKINAEYLQKLKEVIALMKEFRGDEVTETA